MAAERGISLVNSFRNRFTKKNFSSALVLLSTLSDYVQSSVIQEFGLSKHFAYTVFALILFTLPLQNILSIYFMPVRGRSISSVIRIVFSLTGTAIKVFLETCTSCL